MYYGVTISNMEYIILGLLQLQSRTIYQLRKRVNEGLNLMYSCSMGSIQAAIKKLLQDGRVSVSEISEDGKLKKLYSITERGKNCFSVWLNSPIDDSANKNPELSKIYFMGFAEKPVRIKLIEQHLAHLKKMHSDLEKICKEGEERSNEMYGNEIFRYQLHTAIYGRDLMAFNIGWYSRLLKNIGE